MNKSALLLSALTLCAAAHGAAAEFSPAGPEAPATVIRDRHGIAHIYAAGERDLFYLQGRVHAEDRLFQMDVLRRSAAGTLAELFGPGVIGNDVEARTLDLAGAARRSLAAHPPAMIAILDAYAAGVNSQIEEAVAAGRLPPEYAALGLATVARWTPLDTVLIGKALAVETSLIVADDIDLTVALGTYRAVGEATGLFDGSALFFEDLFRSAPFDPAATVPDALDDAYRAEAAHRVASPPRRAGPLAGKPLAAGRAWADKIRRLPRVRGALRLDGGGMGGSNSWVIAGKHTPSGQPLLANDMHLALQNPPIFHEIHLSAPGFTAIGSSLPGAPCVLRGHNDAIAWGITNARLDITDVYLEVLVADPASPSGLATLHDDGHGGITQEAVAARREAFRANVGGSVVPYLERTLLSVPRRNHGPLITAPEPMENPPVPGALSALSVQSVGFGPTRDPEGVCAINRAQDLDAFKAALQLIDFASQNFTYADRDGNIAYFVSGELPLREDLERAAGPVTPPFLVRNGFAGNDWIAEDGARPPTQATPYRILPFAEMPQVVNPPSGVIVSANNDQAGNTLDNDPLNDRRPGGEGLRYLNWGGRNFSIRAGRIGDMIAARLGGGERRWRAARKIGFAWMQRMQADTVQNDARELAPWLHLAWDNANAAGAHPALAAFAADARLAEALARFERWDFTTPTGIAEGYDAEVDEDDAAASVAATIYAAWRGLMVANSIDATLDRLGGLSGVADMPRPGRREELVTALKHLLEHDGVGRSGLDFFAMPGVDDAAPRRDILVLASLADALDLLASAPFAPAFGGSVDQDDYRWGKVHRTVLRHPLGEVEANFNAPPAFGLLPSPLPGLVGLPTDGGFETVDEAPPAAANIRVADSESFAFEFAPTGRFVARPGEPRTRARSSLPGGSSAIPGSPFYLNLLEPWLANESFALLTSRRAVERQAVSIREFPPPGP